MTPTQPPGLRADERELPPLPAPVTHTDLHGFLHTEQQMQEYALQARAALTTQPSPSEVRDAERIQHFEDMANCGYCPTLVFDDDGRWAVSYSGAAPVPEPEGHQETVFITVEVEPDLWRHSVREAIDAAIQAQQAKGGQ